MQWGGVGRRLRVENGQWGAKGGGLGGSMFLLTLPYGCLCLGGSPIVWDREKLQPALDITKPRPSKTRLSFPLGQRPGPFKRGSS